MRWELCKIWKCNVDDPIFDTISSVQWAWICANIAEDKNADLDQKVVMADYLASYWNPESVKKVQEMRKQRELDSEVSDEEFINMISKDEYKNNPLIDAIKRIKETSESDSQNSSPFHSINLNKIIKEGL